ncbi:MAG: dihydroorotate dehydrogenase-like protein [Archangium sp.]|nr:dihydroorotate dehydrogenase-like protein [Archangium sp.]
MDLSTDYLGFKLPHPFMPGASPLADTLDGVRKLEDAGAAAIVMRSLFEEQLLQEQLLTHRYTDFHRDTFPEAGSFLPEPELFHLGPDTYLKHLRKVREAVKVPVIASLNGLTTSSWVEHAVLLEQAGASAIELNMFTIGADPAERSSDLETRAVELLRAVKARVKIPIAVKLSPFYSSLSNVAAQLDRAGAAGLVLFNRLFQPELDIEALEVRRVLHLSDSSELPLRLRWLGVLSSQVGCSLACSGGVHTVADAVKSLMTGADAVQVVSLLLRKGPGELTALKTGLVRWLEEHEYASLGQLRGSMNYETCPDPAAYLRANYLMLLQSWSPEK